MFGVSRTNHLNLFFLQEGGGKFPYFRKHGAYNSIRDSFVRRISTGTNSIELTVDKL